MGFLMNVLTTATILLTLLVLQFPTSDAKAMTCQGIDADGHCIDSKTVEWCDDGVLQTANCPEDEICAKHEDYGDGYLCISKDLTACAGIPDEGLCETETKAVWCLEGELAMKDCGAQEVCGHHDEHGWVDCIPEGELTADAGATPSVPDPDEPGGDMGPSDDDPETQEDVVGGDMIGPTPTVTEGKPWRADEPDGCQASAGPTASIWLLLVCLVFGLRRKRLISRG